MNDCHFFLFVYKVIKQSVFCRGLCLRNTKVIFITRLEKQEILWKHNACGAVHFYIIPNFTKQCISIQKKGLYFSSTITQTI